MFGFKYIRFESTTYVVHYSGGKIVKEGRGLSFMYFAPTSSIVAIPMGSADIPFIFTESTSDFQSITIQGQITFKIESPKQLAELLDFTVDRKGRYIKEDFEKLNQRLVNEAQTATSAYIQSLPLKQAVRSAKNIELKIAEGLQGSAAVQSLGVKPLSVNVVAVKPKPEMERAMEAQTREALQQEADQAIFERRNFAVEQERRIKESELSTEIAVEEKKKAISEKKQQAEVMAAENERRLREMKMQADIALQEQKMKADLAVEENNRKQREIKIQADIAIEEQRRKLVDVNIENDRKLAENKLKTLRDSLEAYKGTDWKTLMALSGSGPGQNIAVAFRELAEKADKIGTLNITPELLETLMRPQAQSNK